MKFEHCATPTVGVEWELQLLDGGSLDLRPGIIPLMEFFPHSDFVKPEMVQSCVELNSAISDRSDAAVRHLGATLDKVLRRCDELHMTACGAGTHPFCRRLALITPTPRYLRLEKTAGYLAHTQLTFSTHVHVGMPSGDAAMRAMSRLIPILPAFIALSANSPFWRGHDTGHAAYRHRILAAAPNYGVPMAFRDWQDFNDFYDAAISAGMIRHFKDIHWGIRPHPDFGTLEIRTMDAARDLSSLHALVAFARILVLKMAAANDGDLQDIVPKALPPWAVQENCFRASHLGLEADFIVNDRGDHRPLRDVIADLISLCDPMAIELGETTGLDLARKMLDGQAGYVRQSAVFAETDSMREVVRQLERQLRGA